MTTFTALFDANILYSNTMSDLIMRLYLVGLFRAKWTEEIHDEWISALLKKPGNHTREKLERRKTLMNKNAGDCLVTNYESLISGLSLPDPDDRHVLAAAITSGSAVIVSFNTSDFPQQTLNQFNIDIQHPDQFVKHLIYLNLPRVLDAAAMHRASLKAPYFTPQQYLDSLEKGGLTISADLLRQHIDRI